MQVFADFSFYFLSLFLSDIWNGSGKDTRNNQSFKSGFKLHIVKKNYGEHRFSKGRKSKT